MTTGRASRMKMTAVALASASWVALATACGGQTGSSAPAQSGAASAPAASAAPAATTKPAPAIDACALVTKAEAEKALGQTLLDPVKSDTGGLFSCEFADPKHPIGKVLTLTVVVGKDAAEVKDVMDLAKSNAAPSAIQIVPDLGDAAYWDSALHALTVNKGRYQLEAFVDPDAGLKAAQSVMRTALTRLPA